MKRKLKVKFILPALTEANSQYWRPVKYSLFPPLGLATLASYFGPEDDIEIQDEHVEKLNLDDKPDLLVLQVYITSAYRTYEIARNYQQKGTYVVMGGIHVTSLPYEALRYANSVFIGPSDDSWSDFISDFRKGKPKRIYYTRKRSFNYIPGIRRDLIKRNLYLVPNSIVVSKGCPYNCTFCYKHSFYKGGISYYTKKVDDALKEIEALPGKHVFFLDDNILGDLKFAEMLFDGMRGMNKIWQGAASVSAVLRSNLIEKAAEAGLRSLFIGFESLNQQNLEQYHKKHNNIFIYNKVIKLLHDSGVMINASFVFGMDEDDQNVFKNTVNWAINQGIETSTFHILTPYPGTDLYNKLNLEKRILSHNWNNYDTRHSVFQPKKMTPEQLENGYWQAYKDFYSWSSIFKSVSNNNSLFNMLRHMAYTSGWKKFEYLWHLIIKLKQLNHMVPMLERILTGNNSYNNNTAKNKDIIKKSETQYQSKEII